MVVSPAGVHNGHSLDYPDVVFPTDVNQAFLSATPPKLKADIPHKRANLEMVNCSKRAEQGTPQEAHFK
jgi:hypothetical protein